MDEEKIESLEEIVMRRVASLEDENERLKRHIARLGKERDHYETACIRQTDEVCNSLGAALGYPRYCDDQKNFPGSTPENGVCVGPHDCCSIAEEAADRIRSLEAEVARLKKQGERRPLSAETLSRLPDDWYE